jgi:hypothetical protein
MADADPEQTEDEAAAPQLPHKRNRMADVGAILAAIVLVFVEIPFAVLSQLPPSVVGSFDNPQPLTELSGLYGFLLVPLVAPVLLVLGIVFSIVGLVRSSRLGGRFLALLALLVNTLLLFGLIAYFVVSFVSVLNSV